MFTKALTFKIMITIFPHYHKSFSNVSFLGVVRICYLLISAGFEINGQCMTVLGTITKSFGFIALCMNITSLVLMIITFKQARIRKNTASPRGRWNALRGKLMKNRKGRVGPKKCLSFFCCCCCCCCYTLRLFHFVFCSRHIVAYQQTSMSEIF